MSYREQPGINNGVNSGEQFKLQSGHHHQQQQPSTSGAMQVSRISSLSDGSSRSHHPQQSYPQPFVEHKLPPPPAVPTSSSSPFSFTTTTTTSSHLSPSSRISSSSSSSRGGGGGSSSEAGRSSKVFKDLHQYLSEGTDSAVTLHSLFSDKPTFFSSSSSPSAVRSSSRQFSLADSTTRSSSKSKNKRTLDDLEEEDRAFECPILPALPVPKTFGGDQVVDQAVDETTRQRLYAENLKTIEQFLSGSNNIAADNGSATIASSPSTAAEAVSTSTTAAEQQQQQQQPNTVMMDVDLPLR